MGWREGDRALPTPTLALEFGLRIDEWRGQSAFPYTIRSGVAEIWCGRRDMQIAHTLCLPQRKVARIAPRALWMLLGRYDYSAAIESNLLDLRAELVELTEMAIGCQAYELFLHARAAFGAGKLGTFCVPKRKRLVLNLLTLLETYRRANVTIYNPHDRWRVGFVTGLHIPCACLSLVGKRSRHARCATQVSIVESDIPSDDVLKERLADAGFCVNTVRSSSALDVGNDPHVIVCDLRALDTTFLAALRRRKPSSRPAVIALSRRADPMVRSRALRNGVSAIVEHDDDPTILMTWCEKLSERPNG